jgi:hypothetical protein
MNKIKFLMCGFFLLSLVGCSSEPPENVVDSFSTHEEGVAELKQRDRSGYLAYLHRINVDLPEEAIEQVYNQIVTFCSEDAANKCTILYSSLNTGRYSSSSLQIRILPDGVGPLLNMATKRGNVSSKITEVEDLQDAIVDGDKRLEMLRQYQEKLIELELKSNHEIDSLIKVTEELAKVQADIEYATGEKAKLLQRTQMDLVHISLNTISYKSFWGPISDSLSDFGDNLSEGISQAIIALPYILIWTLVILPLFYLIRIVWRRTRAK